MLDVLRKKGQSLKAFSSPVRPNGSGKGHHAEVVSEELFRRILCWERKRAERSARCFVLMLVHMEKALETDETGRVLMQVLTALSESSRETDITGWYQKSTTLGVIFTELGEGGDEAFTRLTRVRVMGALKARLATDQINRIHLSFHLLRDTSGKSGRHQPVNSELYPDLFEENGRTRFLRSVKRAMDIAGSATALILFSPLFLVIAIAIKLSSKGPILFKQERVGQYGLRFTFLKFRSMKCGNDPRIHQDYVKRFITGNVEPAGEKQTPFYKLQDDPRITRVGKLLRKTSLDELPQLINVLRGDMSLVGPRPPIPYELEAYQTWHRRRVLEVKPGITGLWQVNGRSKTTFDDMVRLDLRYAKAWSPWLDVQILLRTPRAVLSGNGAC